MILNILDIRYYKLLTLNIVHVLLLAIGSKDVENGQTVWVFNFDSATKLLNIY